MQFATLGKTNLTVSRLCLGTMSFGTSRWRPWVRDEPESREVIRHALESGINFFDTADFYSLGVSEEVVGRALRDFAPREKVIIATKVFYSLTGDPADGGLSRRHIMKAIDDSLRRLGVEYVDLYQIHRYDRTVPIGETLEALHDVVEAGKARHIGASSMWAWQFAQMLAMQDCRGWTRFATMQNHYNLIYREEEREMNPLCLAEGIPLIPWSPLARGFLAGNRRRGQRDATLRERHDAYGHELYYTDADYEIADVVGEVARARNVRPIQVALAWILSRPGVVSPIVSVTRREQLDDLLSSLDLVLSDAEIARLESRYRPRDVRGHE
jgi:aryl-alcohol dehydrogenase (NADP+)